MLYLFLYALAHVPISRTFVVAPSHRLRMTSPAAAVRFSQSFPPKKSVNLSRVGTSPVMF
jgi:hypothetical protein